MQRRRTDVREERGADPLCLLCAARVERRARRRWWGGVWVAVPDVGDCRVGVVLGREERAGLVDAEGVVFVHLLAVYEADLA